MSGQWIVGVISFQKIFDLHGLKHHIVEIRGDVTMQDVQTTNDDEQVKIELLSRWKLEAEFRNCTFGQFELTNNSPTNTSFATVVEIGSSHHHHHP